MRLRGTHAQKGYFYDLVRAGALFANAGRKYYSTGALFADWVIVRASLVDGSGGAPDSSTPKALAFIPRDVQGV